jgi:hypothetical protein
MMLSAVDPGYELKAVEVKNVTYNTVYSSIPHTHIVLH